MVHAIKGQCLCGAVTVTGQVEKDIFDACHCSMCRKWSGGPLFALHVHNPVFTAGEMVTAYASSEWADRGFCKQCGTHLYYLFKRDQVYFMPLGLFDDTNDFQFHSQIFIDSKPPYYAFANLTEELTEAQVREKFGA